MSRPNEPGCASLPGRGRRRALGLLGAGGLAVARGASLGLGTLGLGTLGLGALAPARAQGAGQERFGILGRLAPKIAGTDWIDADGRPTSFAMTELEGRWVYLKCFQSWCPGCHKHGFPALAHVSRAFADDDRIAFIGVQTVFEGFSSNTPDKVREIQQRYALRLKMGHDAGDPEGDHRPVTMRRYRTGGTPWVVLIEPGGHVLYNGFHVDPVRVTAFLQSQLTT